MLGKILFVCLVIGASKGFWDWCEMMGKEFVEWVGKKERNARWRVSRAIVLDRIKRGWPMGRKELVSEMQYVRGEEC